MTIWLLKYFGVNFVDFGEILVRKHADPRKRGVQHPGGVRFLRNEKKSCGARIQSHHR